MEKPEKNMFDKLSRQVGAGKQILEFHKNQHVFEQGDVADRVFYIQKGKVKLTVMSEQGKEAVVAILEPGQFFGEGCTNGSCASHRNHDGDGRLPDHGNHESRDDRRPS